MSFHSDAAHQDNGAYSHHTYVTEETTYGILPQTIMIHFTAFSVLHSLYTETAANFCFGKWKKKLRCSDLIAGGASV